MASDSQKPSPQASSPFDPQHINQRYQHGILQPPGARYYLGKYHIPFALSFFSSCRGCPHRICGWTGLDGGANGNPRGGQTDSGPTVGSPTDRPPPFRSGASKWIASSEYDTNTASISDLRQEGKAPEVLRYQLRRCQIRITDCQ